MFFDGFLCHVTCQALSLFYMCIAQEYAEELHVNILYLIYMYPRNVKNK